MTEETSPPSERKPRAEIWRQPHYLRFRDWVRSWMPDASEDECRMQYKEQYWT